MLRRSSRGFLAQEIHQFSIYFIRMCPCHCMRPVLDDSQLGSLDPAGRSLPCRCQRNDAVAISVNDQCRHVNAGNVLAKILMPGGNARQAGSCRSTDCDIPAGLNRLLANAFPPVNVCVVEVLEELCEEGVPVSRNRFLNTFEYARIHAFRIISGLEEEGWNSADDHGFLQALRTIFSNVPRNFAATHRKACQREVPQLKVRYDFVKVFGKGVVVVASGGLAGSPTPAAVVGNNAMPGGEQHR